MSETLELQQVICPSCKQVITSFSPFQAEVEADDQRQEKGYD